jgi:hypothetical protein
MQRARARVRIVVGEVTAVAEADETMGEIVATARIVPADDLALVVDVLRDGADGPGRVQSGVSSTAQQKSLAATLDITSNDLARAVDAECFGKVRSQGIVQGRVRTAAEEEAMKAGAVDVLPDDLARIIDVGWAGVPGEGVIEGSVFVNRHDLGSSMDRDRNGS